MLGIPRQPLSIPPLSIQTKRRRVTGSIMGGIAETQEMLEFCASHNVEAEVEVVPAGEINNALARLKRNDVRYRFVLDMSPIGR